MPKLLRSTEEEFKDSSSIIYPFVRQIYKRLSAAGVAGIVLAVGWNEFRNLIINTLKMTDNQFRVEEVDRLFIAVNSNANPIVHTKYNSSKGIIRYEFVEAIIKIALKRYIEFGTAKSESEAMHQFWLEYLEPHQKEVMAENPYFYD